MLDRTTASTASAWPTKSAGKNFRRSTWSGGRSAWGMSFERTGPAAQLHQIVKGVQLWQDRLRHLTKEPPDENMLPRISLCGDRGRRVRLPDHENGSIKRVLDAGANALLVPQVDTAAQAKSVIASAMFAPEGNRGVAVGAIPAADNGYAPDTHFANANDALTILTQVESPAAIANLSDLLAIPRLDGVFVGPNDLSAAMGKFRDYDDPAFQSAFEKVLTTTLQASKLFGALPLPGNDADTLVAKGAHDVPNGSDQGFLRNVAVQLVKEAADK